MVGLIGIYCFIFAESGLFFGFFLPGDSLLFTAGVLASAGYFNFGFLFIGCFVCAVLGDSVGYYFGTKVGPKIFTRQDSFFWNQKNIEKTNNFYKKYGNKTITLARFVPIIRTFAPIMAGVGKMKYKVFLLWNILGGFLWVGVVTTLGYFLGNHIKNIDKIILPIILLIIFISIVPILFQFIRERKKIDPRS